METILRIFIVYIFILVSLRILGKRELNELTAFELILLMLIPEMVTQSLSQEDYSISNALIGVSTLFCLVFITSLLTHRFKKMGDLIDGKATLLVRKGRFIPDAMNVERIPSEEILSEVRKHGLENMGQVKWVVLENDGKLSIIPYSDSTLEAEDKKAI